MNEIKQVRAERTGWRDESFSKFHRELGFDSPCVDIDFLHIEFNAGIPVALIEAKAFSSRNIDLSHPSYRAQKILADNSQIPFFIVFYDARIWRFTVLPANDYAFIFVKSKREMTKIEYAMLMYKLRGKTVPDYVLSALRPSRWSKPAAHLTRQLPIPTNTNRKVFTLPAPA